MASTFETGHSINVANGKTAKSSITAFGATYNPTKNAIKLPALSTKIAAADIAVKAVEPVKKPYDDSVDIRRDLYVQLDSTTRSAVNAFSATDGIDAEKEKECRRLGNLITGANVKKKTPPPPPDDAAPGTEPTTSTHSVSQQSYDKKAANFRDLIAFLTASTYNPNETELQVAALTTFADSVDAANTDVDEKYIPYSAALTTRDKELYFPATGLVPLMTAVKKYVKSVAALTATQKKQITSLKFTTPAKKFLHF